MHRKVKIAFLIIVFLFQIVACAQGEKETVTLEEAELERVEETEELQTDSIFVYVCGAVKQEGVYELPAGSRVYEAVAKAGGFREDAAKTQVNQAEVLQDEAQIYVPTFAEQEEQQTQEDGKVNLNTASKEELMTLPGVGEAKADSIIAYREQQGRFETVEDIMQISGIKEGLFVKIKDYITV